MHSNVLGARGKWGKYSLLIQDGVPIKSQNKWHNR